MTPHLNLGIICGAIEPAILRRFLDNFRPLARKIIIVFASGAAERDPELAEIASAMPDVECFHYHNAPEFAGWPHVDSFAAARNMAFRLASRDSEWVMWADTDDIIAPEAISEIHSFLSEHGSKLDMVQLPYRIPYQNVNIWRERIVRASIAAADPWCSPVHEFMHQAPGEKWRTARCDGGVITHGPGNHKDAKGGRNLRILRSIPEAELTTSHRYHLAQECLVNGLLDEARTYGLRFISDTASPEAEAFDIALTLAQHCGEGEDAAALRMMAALRCPWRREAWYELALGEMRHGRQRNALALLRAADAQPVPRAEETPWNIRRKIYGWAGVQLRAMVERANGFTALGDAREYNFAREHGPRISLLHATRGRPALAMEARQRWLDRASRPEAIEHLFIVDADDEASEPLQTFRTLTIPPGGGPVRAWNCGAHASCGAVLVQMSDDWDPPQDWDDAIIAALPADGRPAVLRISDGIRRDGLLCMAIVTRAYWENTLNRLLFHPGFFSMFSDNWLTTQAEREGVIVEAPQIVFRHLHPAAGLAEMDDTYRKSNRLLHYACGWNLYRLLSTGQPAVTWREIGGYGSFAEVTERAIASIPPGGTFVEVGVAQGRNLALAAVLADFRNHHEPDYNRDETDHINVVGVDTFEGDADCGAQDPVEGEKICRANLAGLGVSHVARVLRSTSVEAARQFADEGCNVVFIDAAHDFASVLTDVAEWWPKIAPGGVMCGHDIERDSVRDAVAEHCRTHGLIHTVIGECWWLEKPASK